MFWLLHIITNLVISVSAVQHPVYHLLETNSDFLVITYCLVCYLSPVLLHLKSLRSKHDRLLTNIFTFYVLLQ